MRKTSHHHRIVPIMTLERLSPSRASDFKQCPQLFKFKSIDKLPEPTTIYQARGTTAHTALQNLFDLAPDERTPEALYDLFRTAWSETRGSEEFADLFESLEEERQWGLDSMELLRNYFSVEDPTTTHPADRELDMLEDLDGIVIRGILDRIDETPDGDLVILDYKTGKAPPERYAMPAFFALKVYALLIRKRTGKTPIELRLMYLTGPTEYRLPVTDQQLDAIDQHLRALWARINEAIETNNFPATKNNLCGWCFFQNICPAWADEAASEESAAIEPTSPRPEPISSDVVEAPSSS